MTYDAGDVSEVKKRKSRARLDQEREIEELRQILQTRGGRNWIWRLLSDCGVFSTLSVHDPHSMAIRSGRRDVGLKIIEEVFQADHKAFQLMQMEAAEAKLGDNDDDARDFVAE